MSWYLEDFEQRKEEFREAAARIDSKRDPFDVVRSCSPQYSNPSHLLSDIREIVGKMRIHAQDYVTLPEGECCEVGPLPEASKLDCPTVMYGPKSSSDGQIVGRMGVNVDNYDAFTRADLWSWCAHECYPGHHTNYAKAAVSQLPASFRLGMSLSRCLLEGQAHRSEMLMMPYYEDDVARLAAKHRALYTAFEVKAEIDLNYYGRPHQEIYQAYLEDIRVNEMTARLQVQAHLMHPGDAVCYYSGARVLDELRQELNMEQRTYMEAIFSFGSVSLNTMKHLVAMTPNELEGLRKFSV